MGLEGHFEFLIQPLYQEEPTRRPIGRRHDEKKNLPKNHSTTQVDELWRIFEMIMSIVLWLTPLDFQHNVVDVAVADDDVVVDNVSFTKNGGKRSFP